MAWRQGRPSSSTRGGHNQKLQDPQNYAVQDYLTMLHYAGTSANLEALVLAANKVLFYLGSTGNSFAEISKAIDDSTLRVP